MEWGTPVQWGWFLLFSRSGGHKTKESYPTRPGSPTPCKQGLKGLFTWSGGTRSSGFGFFCFQALVDTKQTKLTPLNRGPPLHVNRVLVTRCHTCSSPLLLFFHCCSFSPSIGGRQRLSSSHLRYNIFMLFFQGKNVFFVSLSLALDLCRPFPR